MAVAWNDDATDYATALTSLKETLTLLGIYPWCGLCGSTDLRFDDQVTPFRDMDEAGPVLELLQLGNLAAMAAGAQGAKPN